MTPLPRTWFSVSPLQWLVAILGGLENPKSNEIEKNLAQILHDEERDIFELSSVCAKLKQQKNRDKITLTKPSH